MLLSKPKIAIIAVTTTVAAAVVAATAGGIAAEVKYGTINFPKAMSVIKEFKRFAESENGRKLINDKEFKKIESFVKNLSDTKLVAISEEDSDGKVIGLKIKFYSKDERRAFERNKEKWKNKNYKFDFDAVLLFLKYAKEHSEKLIKGENTVLADKQKQQREEKSDQHLADSAEAAQAANSSKEGEDKRKELFRWGTQCEGNTGGENSLSPLVPQPGTSAPETAVETPAELPVKTQGESSQLSAVTAAADITGSQGGKLHGAGSARETVESDSPCGDDSISGADDPERSLVADNEVPSNSRDSSPRDEAAAATSTGGVAPISNKEMFQKAEELVAKGLEVSESVFKASKALFEYEQSAQDRTKRGTGKISIKALSEIQSLKSKIREYYEQKEEFEKLGLGELLLSKLLSDEDKAKLISQFKELSVQLYQNLANAFGAEAVVKYLEGIESAERKKSESYGRVDIKEALEQVRQGDKQKRDKMNASEDGISVGACGYSLETYEHAIKALKCIERNRSFDAAYHLLNARFALLRARLSPPKDGTQLIIASAAQSIVKAEKLLSKKALQLHLSGNERDLLPLISCKLTLLS